MQRRIAIALVLSAFASIVLVGLGVLAIWRLGSVGRATERVNEALGAVADIEPGGIANLSESLGLQRLEPVGIDLSTGAVMERQTLGNRRRGGPNPGVTPQLTANELETLSTQETVIRQGGGSVTGIRLLRVEFRQGGRSLQAALLAEASTNSVPRETVLWFGLSSLLVLLGAAVAGTRLAQRLVSPIREIQSATTAIAAGDLTTRVEADGPDELGELGRSVNQMAIELERSQALERQFLMSVSHDLRTPLTAIAGYAEALRDGAVGDPATAGDVIGNHATRLERLVGDLLDLAKLDADRFSFKMETVDAAVVAGRTVAGLAPEAAQGGVTIESLATTSPMVSADPDRLSQAVANLVTNAVSFATTEVKVETVTDGTKAVITVADDGPGFAPEDLPYVFERLYTSSARPRRAENSSGLGLSIVRELITAMGGHVTANNSPQGGALLTISLPLITSPTPREAAQ